jgi:uncharacterized membrane protein
MGLGIMIIGLAMFFGVHTLTTMRSQRAALIARTGEVTYKVVYSLLSLVAIALIAYGFSRYRAAGMIEVWDPPRWLRHVNNLLLWPAFICIAAAYIPGDIKRVLNGDLGSIILFGSFLAWAVYDRITLKRRTDPGAPDFGLGGRDCDTLAVVVGTLVYLALGFWFHPYVVGVPAFVR